MAVCTKQHGEGHCMVAAKVIPISQSDKTVVMKEIETVQYKYNIYAGAHSS